jgi:hypothetical protein
MATNQLHVLPRSDLVVFVKHDVDKVLTSLELS